MCIYCIHIFTGGKPVWENTNHRSTITSQTQQKAEEDDDEDDVRFRYKLEQVDESECVRGDSGRSYIDHSEKNGGSGRNSVLRVVR